MVIYTLNIMARFVLFKVQLNVYCLGVNTLQCGSKCTEDPKCLLALYDTQRRICSLTNVAYRHELTLGDESSSLIALKTQCQLPPCSEIASDEVA